MLKYLIITSISFLYLNAECLYLNHYKASTYYEVLKYHNKLEKVDTLYYHAGTANTDKIKENLNKCLKEEVISFRNKDGLNLMEDLYLNNFLNKELAELLTKEYDLSIKKEVLFDFLKKEDIYINSKVLLIILEKGNMSINELDENGNSFLHIVVNKNNFDIEEIKTLLKNEINIKIKNKEKLTALNIIEKELKNSNGKRKEILKETIKLIKRIEK